MHRLREEMKERARAAELRAPLHTLHASVAQPVSACGRA